MAQGDVLFYTGTGDLLGKLISWWTHSPYVHVGIDIGSEQTVEAVAQGIIERPITAWKPATMWSYSAHNINTKGLTAAIDWLISQVGQPYGLDDLINGAISSLEYENSIKQSYSVSIQHYDCSALATEFLIKAGGVDLGKLSHNVGGVTPATLSKQLGVT